MYSVDQHTGYFNYIFQGILFIYDLFKYDKITNATIFLSLNKYIYKKSSVQSRFVFEPGTCSLNDLDEMIRFLKLLYYTSKNDIPFSKSDKSIKSKYNDITFKKFRIRRLPHDLRCNHNISKEHQFLINHNFQVNGKNVLENYPLKLHKCVRNEAESVYRQIQSGISYEDKIMSEFIAFSHTRINKWVDEYYEEHPEDRITLEEYYSKIGPRRHEYEQGYEEYQSGIKYKMMYKMHNKDDEKQFINFNDFKSKSRNICAQLPMGKIILALPCELGMKVIHSKDWCGPGNNYKTRCEKFSKWIASIGYNTNLICCDGSSFDSTQHKILIDEIDTYFLNRIIDMNPLLNEFFDYGALYKYASQSSFRVYSKSGFLYDIQGTQLSGRMNTCLSNTMRSALYIEFILYKMGILDKHEICKFEVNGDDQIIFMNGNYVNSYIYNARKFVYADKESNIKHGLGQICKIFDVYPDITGGEYLSCYFIYSKETGKIWMIRKPERFFQMVPFTFRVQNRNKKKLMLARTLIGKEIITGAKIELRGVKLYECLLNKYLNINLKVLSSQTSKLNKSFRERVQKQISKIKQESFYKNRGDQDFNQEFNDLFEKFLLQKFNINSEDLQEFYEEVSKVEDQDGEIHVTIVDKFFDSIRSPLDFEEKCRHLYDNKSYKYMEGNSNKIRDWKVQQKHSAETVRLW
jgi:hypothetical protein